MKHDNSPDKKQGGRILLAVTGLTPQVVTETLYALACRAQAPWIPDEVHVITTATGAENIRLQLLEDEAWFHRLIEDYGLPPIVFTTDQIHVLRDGNGAPLDDIRTQAENNLAADFITKTVQGLTSEAHTELHVSIAGGRKTMGYYLGYALSLYGRAQDRLSHVLVGATYESHPRFYYPTPYTHTIHNERTKVSVDARHGRVELADIPFVRLRDGLPSELLRGTASFSDTVAAAQCPSRRQELVLHPEQRIAYAGGEKLELSAQNFALLLWMARRRKHGNGPLHSTSYDADQNAAREYLALCKALFGSNGAELDRAEQALGKGMDSTWFSPAKHRLKKSLIRALGENGARPYMIQAVGKRADALFELTLPAEKIQIKE